MFYCTANKIINQYGKHYILKFSQTEKMDPVSTGSKKVKM
jgi:hypothetical protein